jgi:hypothetical protein
MQAKTVVPHIYYFIIIPEDAPEQASPLQGFSFGMVAASRLFQAIVELPADVVEMALPPAAQAGRRTNGVGAWQWTPLAEYALSDIHVPAECPFWVMLTVDIETATKVDRWIKKQSYKPLHISMARATSRTHPADIAPEEMRKHFQHVLALVEKDFPNLEKRLVSQGLEAWSPRASHRFGEPVPGHNITIPNVMALQGIGIAFEDAGPFVGTDPDDFMQLVAYLANRVLDYRKLTYSSPAYRTTPAQPDVFVTAPALYNEIYESGLSLPPGEDSKPVRALLQIMQRQSSYQLRGSGKAWVSIMKSPIAQTFLRIRAMETNLQVVAAGLTAAGTLSATVRVSPAVNRVQGAIRQLASHARSDKIKPAGKLVKSFAHVQDRLATAVGPELIAVIDRAEFGVKLVTDVPLEWLPLGNLPLMLRKDVSRITATPGNLQIGMLSRNELLHLSAKAFLEVLVISAFEPSDPIAKTLLDMLDHWQPSYAGKIALRIIKVATRDEFVAALNAFSGAVMIFDGHGSHDQSVGHGTLRIGREDVSIWDLRSQIRVPPVVILSACDTQAASRSHATTANAFLHAGALTVVASLLPLRANDAAILVARLVWRLAEFLPAVTGPHGRAFLWSEVMAGMLRLQVIYDLLMPLVEQGKLTLPDYQQINFQAINETTNREPDWWDDALAEVQSLLGLSDEAVAALGRETIATSDAIRYAQIGNPEKIVIKSEALLHAVGYDMDE